MCVGYELDFCNYMYILHACGIPSLWTWNLSLGQLARSLSGAHDLFLQWVRVPGPAATRLLGRPGGYPPFACMGLAVWLMDIASDHQRGAIRGAMRRRRARARPRASHAPPVPGTGCRSRPSVVCRLLCARPRRRVTADGVRIGRGLARSVAHTRVELCTKTPLGHGCGSVLVGWWGGLARGCLRGMRSECPERGPAHAFGVRVQWCSGTNRRSTRASAFGANGGKRPLGFVVRVSALCRGAHRGTSSG